MMNFRLSRLPALALLLTFGLGSALAEDWRGFLGTDHDGTSDDTVPLKWGGENNENIAWSVDLPGHGNSSPIIVDGKVFLTCFTGYGLSRENPGDINELARHLLCFDAKTGKKLWRKTVKARQPEDVFKGYIQEHGYASNTPVSDGEHVFVFMGKTGLLAFDMDGNEKWRTYVGGESNNKRWGSASAPVLWKDTVIVNASDEGQALCAFDKATGKEVWRQEASTMSVVYAMPRFIEIDDRTDMVMRVSGEIWGLNPDTGKLRWFAEHDYPGTTTATVQTDGKRLYTFGGFPKRATIALDLGGKGDLTNKIAWKNEKSIPASETPILNDGRLYWVDGKGFANCLDTKDGSQVYKERIGLSGAKIYASPILVGDKIIAFTRNKGAVVYATGDEFEVLHTNVIAGDDSEFGATPAVSDGGLFVRSWKKLYCIRK